MKIAYISTLKNSAWGGSEELWYQSAQEAIRRNYQLGVFIYDWADEPTAISELRSKGVAIFKRPRKLSRLQRLINKGLARLTGTLPLFLNPYHPLLTFKPDIIVITDGATYYTADDENLSALLLERFRNRYVIVSQSNSAYHIPADRAHATALFENALRVFFVSEQNKRLAFHQLATSLSRAEVIQNPVLLNNFDMQPMPAFEGTLHCAVVGRFCISDKGQDILVAMMSDPYWKQVNIRLHLYGKGEDANYLEKLIAFYNVSDKVAIEGFTTDRGAIWNTCHCLLMCSHKEGTPLTLLEAMVAGRVCIVTNVGGNAEWVRDGYNGFLADAPTEQLFSLKLKEAIARQADWEHIASTAHNDAMKKIDRHPGKTLLDKINQFHVPQA